MKARTHDTSRGATPNAAPARVQAPGELQPVEERPDPRRLDSAGVLGLQRLIGNAATTRIVSNPARPQVPTQRLGRAPLAIYRQPDQDLVAQPVQVTASTRMAPPGWVLVDDAAGNRWQVPMRIYPIDEIPDTPAYNARGFPTPSRFTFLGGTLMERAEQQRESNVLTVGEIRAFAQGAGRRAVRVAMARTPDGVQPVGVDTWIPTARGGPAAEGFVASGESTRLVGRDLLVNRIRETLQAGGSSVMISVGNDPDTLEFHRRLTQSVGLTEVDIQTGSHYQLEPVHMARLLADESWGRSLAPGTRDMLRTMALVEVSAADLRDILGRDPSVLRAERGPMMTRGIGEIGGRGSPEAFQQRQATVHAGAAVVLFGLTLLSEWLNSRFEAEQLPLVQAAFENTARGASEHLADRPQLGALFRIVYRQATSPETPITGPRVFGWVEVGYGRTTEEAVVNIQETPAMSSSLGYQEHWLYETQWVPPRVASQAFELRTPFPRHALAGVDGTSVELQNVKWDVGGFDDEGTSTVSVPAGQQIRFHVLSVPSNLFGHTIPVSSRSVTGGSIPVVDLDPNIPWTETYAAAIFPANEATATAFRSARELEAYVNFPVMANISMLRWIRADAVRLIDETAEP